jgi:hypothetical protein
MKLSLHDKRTKPVFDFQKWIKSHSPLKKRTGTIWDDVHLEYEEVLEEFKTFLESTAGTLVDKNNEPLTFLEAYNAIEEYKIRIDKLMLIFNLRLYKTYNVNKKTNVRYIVMRAFWIDWGGKNVRWFSRNIGAENKVAPDGKIPQHMIRSVEEDILHLMWDQYNIDYNDPNSVIAFDEDGNAVIVED